MVATAIVGANWGDEGKGKVTDHLAEEADLVVRFQGGANAGHTIINKYGKFVLHLLPSGVFHPHVTNVLGPGVALNIDTFMRELGDLHNRGVDTPQVRVSNRAQVVLPYHCLLDQYEEERLGAGNFGSTRQGIAPFYADKYMKIGVQVADLYDEQRLHTRIDRALAHKNALFTHLYAKPTVTVDEIVAPLLASANQLRPYICDTTLLLHNALAQGERILLEGQLGALRDPDHGIYPYPTSSAPLAGFATVGAGIPPNTIRQIVATAKAYSSCVGAGPFVTELFGEEGDELRQRGGDDGEYGATTGRPRRVGWFDAVATHYGCRLQGATDVALTLLDVLGYLDEIPICVAYEIDGKQTADFPTTGPLERATPVYEMMAGWQTDISSIRSYDKLPDATKGYISRVEALIGVPIKWLGVGPRREQLIIRH